MKPVIDMPLWKRVALGAYYHATYPGRQWHQCRAMATGEVPIAVLVFHRVADDRANSWTTSTADFVAGMRWLKSRFELISLAEVHERLRSRHSPRPAVCITFDDGYADNCRVALPLLVEERIPCTYFVTTKPVLEGTPFTHDVDMGNRLTPNTVEELRHFSRAGIEIGAHTRTHADLGQVVDPVELHDELITATKDLEAAVDQPIRHFAFPFGMHENLTSAAFHAAREGGFEAVCSAYGGYNVPGDDPFHIQRRCIDGPVIRLKNWVTVDPLRKMMIPRFEYDPAACAEPCEAV